MSVFSSEVGFFELVFFWVWFLAIVLFDAGSVVTSPFLETLVVLFNSSVFVVANFSENVAVCVVSAIVDCLAAIFCCANHVVVPVLLFEFWLFCVVTV